MGAVQPDEAGQPTAETVPSALWWRAVATMPAGGWTAATAAAAAMVVTAPQAPPPAGDQDTGTEVASTG
ncbi:hypothetical protein ACF08N_00615 [Streptomyces sp. NPDC015127]|uniref:hypothetical protein n=1 Tax=Streptomyces sp. NPDC015127 TaxID=3364939 RepID=UPI0036F68A98